MITTPIAHHSVPTSRALSSTPFRIANAWLGGSMRADEGTRSSNVGTSYGFASKRIAPGRLEGMT